MAQELEPLNLKITGNANGLSAALGKAQGDISGFKSNIGALASKLSSIASVASFATLVAGATAAAIAIGKIKDQLDKIDDASKSASKLSLAFSELQGLRLAIGESAGLDNDSIDKSLQRFQLNLGEAAQKGSGDVYDALARVGLEAGELLRAGPVEALKQVADATAQIQSPTDQLLLAYELFGKQGVGIVATLRAGREAIEDSYNFGFKWLGLTQEQVALVEASNDSWDRVGAIVSGIVQVISAELAPVFLAVTESITESAEGFGSISSNARAFSDFVAVAVGYTINLAKALTGIAEAMQQISNFEFSKAADTLSEAFAQEGNPGDDFKKKVDEVRRRFAESAPKNRGLNAFDEATIEGLEGASNALNENGKSIDEWKRKAESIKDSLASPIERYSKTIEELSEAVLKGGLDMESFARGVARAQEELERATRTGPIKVVTFGSAEDRALNFERRDPKPNAQNAVQAEIAKLKERIAEAERNKPQKDQGNAIVAEKIDQTNIKLDQLRISIEASRPNTRPVNL